jgi:hypothetical protein
MHTDEFHILVRAMRIIVNRNTHSRLHTFTRKIEVSACICNRLDVHVSQVA